MVTFKTLVSAVGYKSTVAVLGSRRLKPQLMNFFVFVSNLNYVHKIDTVTFTIVAREGVGVTFRLPQVRVGSFADREI